MKARLELTKEQVDKLVAIDEKQLRMKFEKDLASIRKKYGSIEIDTENLSPVKTHKAKITDEMFNDYFNVQKLSIQQISEITELNKGYLYKIRKRVQNIT